MYIWCQKIEIINILVVYINYKLQISSTKMQASPAQKKPLPVGTLNIYVLKKQYNRAAVLAMVSGATNVMFGFVDGKFAAIFHFDTPIPPKVNKKELSIQIAASSQQTSSQKPSACCGSDCCVAGGGGVRVRAPVVPAAPATPGNHDITIKRSAVGKMFNTLKAGKLVRGACKERGYKNPLTLAIFQSQDTHLLTARITTTGTIPLTDDEVCSLIYSTECLYRPVAHSL